LIPVIDLFAGPGGLGEGFSSITDSDGERVFRIIMSVEKDEQAHKTLRLRAYVRSVQQKNKRVPRVYERYLQIHDADAFEKLVAYDSEAWEASGVEALCATLREGDGSLVEEARKRLKARGIQDGKPWVLIGGPPCQAYSLVGRSRRTHDHAGLEADPKQTLYKCYLAFINELQPTVFVMENVKGLLSAKHEGDGVFQRILADMHEAGYEIHSLVKSDPEGPQDYVVEAERYGIPQARHRVILFGIKRGSEHKETGILVPLEQLTVREAFKGIPKICSGFSSRNKGWREMNWASYIDSAADELLETKEGKELEAVLLRVKGSRPPRKMSKSVVSGKSGPYTGWYRGSLGGYRILANHEARTHMARDLDRYLFCSAYAEAVGVSAQLYDFPSYLIPAHKNAQAARENREVEFPDRFRVQLYDRPSTTITSHIAKDGHYYIHPDPEQCRSLTVREAARLQTFPDDYLFEGNRTSQYTQVGNAVPPLLAQQIAKVVAKYLGVNARTFFDGL
jgi:DNA (cytosine-5)-methyltransferase 1